MSLNVFPVAGGARISNDFNDGSNPNFRKHLGNDLFAPQGTPVVAVDHGTVRFGTDTLGGNVANLTSSFDGNRYYYAHLSAWEGQPRVVEPGEVIGYVGMTGNAQGTVPHLHFEMRPGGGSPVDPAPALQRAPETANLLTSGRPSLLRGLLPLLALGLGGAAIYAYMKPAKARVLWSKVKAF